MSLGTHFSSAPGGSHRDTHDHQRLREARERHEGFTVGKYLQPAPMLFTRDGHNVFLGDVYRGSSAFLICAGPSLASHDLTQLERRGILTLAVNNAATVVRPKLWTSVDDPGNFADAIWRDPGIWKFVPLCHMEKSFLVRDSAGQLIASETRVGDMPAVFGYRRNECFKADQFLYEDTFNWGNHSNLVDAYGNKGSRSIMLVALRLLFYLGVRKIYLLGCDFRMEFGQQNYAFDQDRSKGSVRGNNSTYQILNVRLQHLKPHFEREGCEIINCTPNSGLTVFPYLPYEQAVVEATRSIPTVIQTAGMYDRKQREKADAPHLSRPSRKPSRTAASDAMPLGSRAQKTIAANSRRVDPSPRIPRLTLVVGVDQDSAPHWKASWQTWMRFKAWLGRIPLLVLHDRRLQAKEFAFARSSRPLRAIPYDVGTEALDDNSVWRTQLCQLARHVQTPWYLWLDPRAIACDPQSAIDADWFERNENGKAPAFVACPWGYTKPADALARLDEWASRVTALQAFPDLAVPFDPAADRVRHSTIATWCLFGNAAWTREVATISTTELPPCSLGAYLNYVATRRGDHFVRVKMKQFGWKYSFRQATGVPVQGQEVTLV